MLASGRKFLHRKLSEVNVMNEQNHRHGHPHDPSHSSQEGKTHKDLVCGMTVKETTPHTYDYAGQRYFFCGARCLEKFRAEPAKYLAPVQDHSVLEAPVHTVQARTMREGALYTCPMHPEVRQPGPGSC